MNALLRYARPIPAVLVLGVALLAIKGAGLAVEARAQEQTGAEQTSAASEMASNPSSDPAADDTDNSSAQIDVLSSLAKRRAELDARERDLDMRDNLIAAAEKRVDTKIDSLKDLQSQIQALLVQRDAADQKQLDALVKTYSTMRPRDAARIFDNLNEDVLLSVAVGMKPDVLGAILAQMQPEMAQKLTLRLANRVKLPDNSTAAAPAQVAAAGVTPAPASPVQLSNMPAASLNTPAVPSGTPAVPGAPDTSAPANAAAPNSAGK